jgi:hypothetical protein
MDTLFTPLAGGCKCFKVRFRMEGPPIITHCCHRRDCQRESGSAFCVNAMVETDRRTVLGAAPRLVAARRSKRSGFGWKRWSNDIVYGKWGLFGDYRLQYASVKARADRTAVEPRWMTPSR